MIFKGFKILFQECIKPIKIDKVASNTGSKIRIENDGSYVQLQQVWGDLFIIYYIILLS